LQNPQKRKPSLQRIDSHFQSSRVKML